MLNWDDIAHAAPVPDEIAQRAEAAGEAVRQLVDFWQRDPATRSIYCIADRTHREPVAAVTFGVRFRCPDCFDEQEIPTAGWIALAANRARRARRVRVCDARVDRG